MKIKVAILDIDEPYLNRITPALESRYTSRLELYCFTDKEKALKAIEVSGIHILLSSTVFEIDVNKLPAHCCLAYLAETNNFIQYNGHNSIFKYQKIEQIFNAILTICADSNIGAFPADTPASQNKTDLYVFTSASGGVGASSVAIAFSIYNAKHNNKTLYINLECFGNTDIYFNGTGQADFRDILYTIKSGNTNAIIKFEGSVKKDSSGVFYISSPKSALDLFSLTENDIDDILSLCYSSALFDCIIIDADFSIDEKRIALFKKANALIFVTDGSEVSNEKLNKAFEAITQIEQQAGEMILAHSSIFYNKFSKKTGGQIEFPGIKIIGGSPKYEHTPYMKIINNLADSTQFADLYAHRGQ